MEAIRSSETLVFCRSKYTPIKEPTTSTLKMEATTVSSEILVFFQTKIYAYKKANYFFYLEDGGSRISRNVGSYLPKSRRRIPYC
jgi:hypothetical protein